MAQPRIHVDMPLPEGAELALPDAAARHVAQVLRMRADEPLTLFNGDGHDYSAQLLTSTRRAASVRVTGRLAVDNESPLRVTLLQSVSKGERMDWVMQKSVELGVHEIVPVITERTVVRIDATRMTRKVAHWRGVVVSACEQCGRALVPEVREPLTLDEALTTFSGLLLDPLAQRSLVDIEVGGDDIALLIGPEGGLSEAELAQAAERGWWGVSLGPRVLRTETAALAALTALQLRAGDLG